MRNREHGAALVAVVMVTLALFAIGHGLLGLALGELAGARAAVRVLEAHVAAESSVSFVLAGPGPAWLDSVAVGGERSAMSRSFGRADGSATVWRLSREAWWVEGRGRVGIAETRTARLAWAMDPISRVMALSGAVTVSLGSPVTIAGRVDASAPLAVDPPLVPTDCDPWAAQLRAHYAIEALVPLATLVADTLPSVGLLDFTDLLDAPEIEMTGSVTPMPLEATGRCLVDEPSNWGDPERPWRPCGTHLTLRKAMGPLRVDGGAGQGVLIVAGDLTLDDGARFYGLVLASGALTLNDGAQLTGLAIAAKGAHVATGSVVRASACWAVRALAANRGRLGNLRPMPGQAALGPL